jgi:hypothetical protein
MIFGESEEMANVVNISCGKVAMSQVVFVSAQDGSSWDDGEVMD